MNFLHKNAHYITSCMATITFALYIITNDIRLLHLTILLMLKAIFFK